MSLSSPALPIIEQARLVAIIRLDDLTHAVQISQALLHGGIVAQEFTLTNPASLQVVAKLLAEIPDFTNGRATIGIGSVRTVTEANQALAAGAQFIVSPFTQREVLARCREAGIPCMPGAFTPTEIATAWELEAAVVKVFPARSLGPSYIKDVLAPLPYVKLMPTGGIDLSNLGTYLKSGACAVGIGGNLLDAAALAAHDWERITHIAQQYAIAAQAPRSH